MQLWNIIHMPTDRNTSKRVTCARRKRNTMSLTVINVFVCGCVDMRYYMYRYVYAAV